MRCRLPEASETVHHLEPRGDKGFRSLSDRSRVQRRHLHNSGICLPPVHSIFLFVPVILGTKGRGFSERFPSAKKEEASRRQGAIVYRRSSRLAAGVRKGPRKRFGTREVPLLGAMRCLDGLRSEGVAGAPPWQQRAGRARAGPPPPPERRLDADRAHAEDASVPVGVHDLSGEEEQG